MIVLDLRSGFACGLSSNAECSAEHLQTGGAKTGPVILSKKRVAAMSPDSALAQMWRPFLHVKMVFVWVLDFGLCFGPNAMQCIKGLPVSAGENGPRLGIRFWVLFWTQRNAVH